MQNTIRARRLEGIWLPLITPFCDGEIDESSLTSLIEHYATTPIDGLIVCATTGEGLTLSPEETERVTFAAAATSAGRLPLYLGLCGSDTRDLVQRLGQTNRWPIDGYLITCPYYSRPSQAGLRQHFAALAAQSDKPIALYNIPYRTGVNLANDTVFELAQLKRIVGIKDCCANVAQSFDLLRGRPAGFSVMTGDDALFFNALAHGADGGILASAHTDPAGFAAVRNAYIGGDRAEALRGWSRLVDIVNLLFAEPNPAPIKRWLWCEGRIRSPELRLPMTGVGERLAGEIARAVEQRAAA
jgi:4-hydroxy-tetrahydrodipicolinate synthase